MNESDHEDLELDESEAPKPVLNKNGKPKKVMTPERLEVLARAREKANAVRAANAAQRGKKEQREVAKQRAQENAKIVADNFNKRVDEEVEKRLGSIKLDKMDEMIDQKLAKLAPVKKSKKVVVEEVGSDSETEVVTVKKRREPKPLPQPSKEELDKVANDRRIQAAYDNMFSRPLR